MTIFNSLPPQAPTIADPEKLKPLERWRTEIAYAERELAKFHERGRKVTRRFLDEREAMDAPSKWFNLFYANTQILESALYAQLPKPDVRRKFLDYNDDIARVAASIIQRGITEDLDDPRDTFDAVMKSCVQDRLVPGLATCWLRLETDTEERELPLEIAPEPGEGLGEGNESPPNAGFKTGPANPQEPQKYKVITDQRVAIDYVFWEDFLWSPCRVWAERRWVGRKAYLTREELIRRFGEEKGKKVPLNWKPTTMSTYPNTSTPANEALQKAVVYEIWDRDKRKVYWLSTDYDVMLDERDDPLNLVGFEPCPEPMFANTSTSNCTPRPDYFMIQDQYSELDTVNNRISLLVQACKVVGVYDRAAEGVQRMLLEGFDNSLIPVDNWAMFAEKGGVKGQVDWLPLDQIIAAMQQLYQAREAIKGQIYELTGIADIVRGASKASETLGAQEIKAKFASVRISKLQTEVACFAAEILRIKAELMVKHFDPEILVKKSGILMTDDAELVPQAVALLTSEEGFEWRITVTSDQIAQADYAMEKEDRIELLGAVSVYLEKAFPMVQQMPEAAPLIVNLLKWSVASFRGARDIESMLDRTLDAVIKQPPQPKPDPKAEAEKAKQAGEQQRMQQDMQMKQQTHQMDLQAKQAELSFKEQAMQMEMAMKQMELQFKQKEQEMNQLVKQMEMYFKQLGLQQDMEASQTEHAMEMEQNAQNHELSIEQQAQLFETKQKQAKQQAKAKPNGKA